MEFKRFKRVQEAELRPLTEEELELGVLITTRTPSRTPISISDVDLRNGSPKRGDMVARNPKNHLDQWLVEHQYFKDNFVELTKD